MFKEKSEMGTLRLAFLDLEKNDLIGNGPSEEIRPPRTPLSEEGTNSVKRTLDSLEK